MKFGKKILFSVKNHLWTPSNGAALVTAVLILLALTLIGLAAVTSSNISMDVSGNLKAKTTSYHAAEACLYYQIRRIKDLGTAAPALTQPLGPGMSCSASIPTLVGGGTGSSTGTQNGFSLEVGSQTGGTIPYSFTVTGNGPRNAVTSMVVEMNFPAPGGGY